MAWLGPLSAFILCRETKVEAKTARDLGKRDIEKIKLVYGLLKKGKSESDDDTLAFDAMLGKFMSQTDGTTESDESCTSIDCEQDAVSTVGVDA